MNRASSTATALYGCRAGRRSGGAWAGPVRSWLDAPAKPSLEGYLFPDTYQPAAAPVRARMLAAMLEPISMRRSAPVSRSLLPTRA